MFKWRVHHWISIWNSNRLAFRGAKFYNFTRVILQNARLNLQRSGTCVLGIALLRATISKEAMRVPCAYI